MNSKNLCLFFFGVVFTDSTMGFITMIHRDSWENMFGTFSKYPTSANLRKWTYLEGFPENSKQFCQPGTKPITMVLTLRYSIAMLVYQRVAICKSWDDSPSTTFFQGLKLSSKTLENSPSTTPQRREGKVMVLLSLNSLIHNFGSRGCRRWFQKTSYK